MAERMIRYYMLLVLLTFNDCDSTVNFCHYCYICYLIGPIVGDFIEQDSVE
jgi:hypothetical protein